MSHSKVPKASKDPKWKIYERAAAELESAYPDCHVTLDRKVMGRRSGIERQVDVWITGAVGTHEMSIAVECKCYQGRVGIKDIEAFYSFLDDVGANKGVIISDSGFTSGARNRAHSSDMELKTMTFGQAEDFDWTSIWEKEWHGEHERHYTCKTGGCRGSISYMYDDGVKAGDCQSCGQFDVWCSRCNAVRPYDLATTEKHQLCYVRCTGRRGRGQCRAEWRLYFQRGILERIK
jgi:hypothetical protein